MLTVEHLAALHIPPDIRTARDAVLPEFSFHALLIPGFGTGRNGVLAKIVDHAAHKLFNGFMPPVAMIAAGRFHPATFTQTLRAISPKMRLGRFGVGMAETDFVLHVNRSVILLLRVC